MNPKYKNVFFSPNLGAGFDTPDVEPIEDEEQGSPASEESVTRVKPKTRLENLLAKIAGNKDAKEIKSKTKSEALLNEIADNQGEGGGSGGSGGALIVTMTQDEPGGLRWDSETTYGEVYEAMLAGRPVFFKCEGEPFNSDGQEHTQRPVYPVLYVDFDPDGNDPPDDVLYGYVTFCLPNIFGVQWSDISIIRFNGQYPNNIVLSYYD